MSNIPVRNLGGSGIISDVNPYDLAPNAFSAGVNVRFENGNVTRAPIFRNVHDLVTPTLNIGHMLALPDISGGPEALVLVASDYSKFLSVTGATEVDVTPTVITTGDTEQPFTSCFLGNVAYVNRRQNVPFSKTVADTRFQPLANWDASWRCGVLRPFKDTLIALNVTKGGVEFPSMVKWSDFTQFGSVPPSWDATSPTNNAGENILNEMVGPIIDGLALRDSFYIYGAREVWAVNYIGGTFIYDFRKRFNDRGAINTNCVVEVDGLHYVFDNNDIYVHDGASPRSIIHGLNKDFVFGSIKPENKHLFFVEYDTNLNELHFNYVADDRLVGFRDVTKGCNRAAVFNVRSGVWTFYDLPNVTGSTSAELTAGLTYEDMSTLTYPDYAGTYIGEDAVGQKHLLYVGNRDTTVGLTKSRIYGLDLASGGRLSAPIEPESLKPALIERIGIDMDDMGSPLTAYKSLLGFYPQIGIDGEVNTVSFQFGATDTTGIQPLWTTPQIFNPVSQNKIDVRIAGRYLAYRLIQTGLSDFSLSGFDVRANQRGMR
jgi:hypothetical protein